MLDVSTVDWFKEPEDIEYPQRYSATDKKEMHNNVIKKFVTLKWLSTTDSS